MTDRNCNSCLWSTRSGDCRRWRCEFVDKQEAYEAWKEKKEKRNEQRTGNETADD